MQPIVFSLLAMAFYALEISITDWRLTNLSPRLLTACYAVGVAVFSLTALFLTQEKISNPTGRQSIWILLMVMASFFAASAHFQALHLKAGALQLTLIYCMLPVAASLYTAVFEHKFPSFQMIVAWILASLSLYLIATTRPIQLS